MDQKIETITIENISETDEIGQERLSTNQRNKIGPKWVKMGHYGSCQFGSFFGLKGLKS